MKKRKNIRASKAGYACDYWTTLGPVPAILLALLVSVAVSDCHVVLQIRRYFVNSYQRISRCMSRAVRLGAVARRASRPRA